LLGFIQIGIGGLISAAVGIIHLKGSLSTSITMSFSSLTALMIVLIGGKRIVQPVPGSTPVTGGH